MLFIQFLLISLLSASDYSLLAAATASCWLPHVPLSPVFICSPALLLSCFRFVSFCFFYVCYFETFAYCAYFVRVLCPVFQLKATFFVFVSFSLCTSIVRIIRVRICICIGVSACICVCICWCCCLFFLGAQLVAFFVDFDGSAFTFRFILKFILVIYVQAALFLFFVSFFIFSFKSLASRNNK